MIEVVSLTQHYGVRPILRDVSLTFPRGELTVIVGPNGMGKSTLLAAVAGVLSPQHGHVLIDGRQRRASVEDELAIRRTAVYLPDTPWLPTHRTPREFLLAVGRLYGLDDDQLFPEVERLLELFDLASQADALIGSLSAGQTKKVALCSALLPDPPVLLLDEPFSGGLDPAGILVLKRLLKKRVGDGRTVVLTSPVPEIVEEIADRVVILMDGRVVAFDTIDGLRRQAGVGGSLAAVLEKLLFPDTLRKIEAYLGGGGP
jgi:ABC-type multidrug transport system ATPase subunit